MTISQWSTAPANNASGITGINWAEGMPPADVNNSARQQIADVATWYRTDGEWIDRDDAVTFSSGTKVLLTSQDVTSIYNVGRRVRTVSSTPGTLYGRITASSTSGADTLLTIDFDSTAVLSNEAISDISIGIIGNSTGTQSLDAANIARISEFGMPTGMVMQYTSTASEPSGFKFCNGQGLDRTTFADLFAVVGTVFGSTSTATFAVPDMRGRTSVCLDNLGGTSANVLTSTAADTLGGTLGVESTSQSVTLTGSVSAHTLTVSQIPAPTFTVLSRGPGNAGFTNGDIAGAATSGSTGTVASSAITTNYTGGSHTHSDSFAVSTTDIITVVQPSMALPWLIKT